MDRWLEEDVVGDVLGGEVGSGVEGVDSLLSENVLEDGRVGWVKVWVVCFIVIVSKTSISMF